MADDQLAPFLAPVSGDAPAGEDLTYDEAYMRVREEVDRMGTVSVHVDHESGVGGGGGEVDYGEIAREARTLLTERTRDLQLAAYMTIALSRSRAAEGLAEGLETTLALAQTFGEGVHPTKPVRRRNALQFLSDRLKDWLADGAFGADDAAALERAGAAAEALQTWTTETMGENAPALSGLRQAIEEALRRASRATKAEAAPAPAGAPAGTPAAAAPAEAGMTLASASDARKAVARVCAFLRDADATSGTPYRLARAMAWGNLNAEPPNDGGKTQIEGPDAGARAQMQTVAAGGNPAAALEAAEQAFSSRPFWLDLQRIAAQAAGQAGHESVARAIGAATAELLTRLPGLASLSFSDGSPFADDATRGWLQGFAAGGSEAPATVTDDGMAETLEEARTLVGKGDLDGAVRMLLGGGTGGSGGRARLVLGLHVARFCVQGGRPAVAAALIDGLVEDADHASLDQWEPGLALELWRAAHTAWSAAASAATGNARDDAQRRAGAAFDRICRLDPAAALGIAGADKKGPRG